MEYTIVPVSEETPKYTVQKVSTDSSVDTSVLDDTESVDIGGAFSPDTSNISSEYVSKKGTDIINKIDAVHTKHGAHPDDVIEAVVQTPVAAVGALEQIPMAVSSIIAKAVEGVLQLGKMAGKDPETWDKIIKASNEALTYQPQTSYGKAYGELLSAPFEAYNEQVLDSYSSLNEDTRKFLVEQFGVDDETAIKIAAAIATVPHTAAESIPWLLGVRKGEAVTEQAKVHPLDTREQQAILDYNKANRAVEFKKKEEVLAEEARQPSAKPYGEDVLLQQVDNDLFLVDRTITNSDGSTAASIKGTLDTEAGVMKIHKIEHQPGGVIRAAEAVKDLVDRAMLNQHKVETSGTLSLQEKAVFDKMQRDGYDVVKDPSATIDQAGRLVTDDPAKPAYSVFPKKTEDGLAPHIDRAWDAAKAEDAARTLSTKLGTSFTKIKDNSIFETRPWNEIEPTLSVVKEVPQPNGTIKKTYTAVFKDLPDKYATDLRYAPLRGKWINPFFIAEMYNNPVVRYNVSLATREEQAINRTKEKILFAGEIIMSKGRPVQKPTNKGFLTRWSAMSKEEQHVTLRLLKDMQQLPDSVLKDLKKKGLTQVDDAYLANHIRAIGRNPNEYYVSIKFYKDLIEMGSKDLIGPLEKTSTIMESLGRKGIFFEKSPGFFPRKWEPGDFYSVAVDKTTGRPLETITSKTNLPTDKFGVGHAEKILREKFPDAKIYSEKRQVDGELQYETLYELLKISKEEGTPTVTKFLEQQTSKTGIKVHGLERKGSNGFLWDIDTHGLEKASKGFEATLERFVTEALQAESSMRIRYYTDLMDNKITNKLYPNSVAYSKAFMDDYLGRKPLLDKVLDDSVGEYIGKTAIKKGTSETGKFWVRTQILMLNLAHIALQPVVYKSTIQKLNGLASEHGVPTSDIALIPFKSMDKILRKDPETLKLLETATERGAVSTTFARYIYEKTFEEHRHVKYVDEKIYSYFDELTRTMSVVSFYEYFRNNLKQDHDTAATNAIELGTIYSVPYTSAQTPAAYQGTTGRAVGLFQRFASNEFGQVIEALHNAKDKQQYKQLATLVGLTATVAGVKGLWGVDDADKAVGLLNETGLTDSKLPSMYIYDNYPDFMVNGPAQQITGTDWSQIQSPSMTRNITSLPMLSLTYEVGVSFGTLFERAATLRQPTSLEFERALLSVAPNPALKEVIKEAYHRGEITWNPKTWLMREGETYTPINPKTGKGSHEMKREDQLRRIFGGKSLEQTKIELVAEWAYSLSKGSKANFESVTSYVAMVEIMNDNIDTSELLSNLGEKWGYTYKEIRTAVDNKSKAGYVDLESRLQANKKAQKVTKGQMMEEIDTEKEKRYTIQRVQEPQYTIERVQ